MRKSTILAASLLALACAAPAAAAKYLISATGTITGSSDAAGVFGDAGGNIDGNSFSLVYFVDTGLGLRTTFTGGEVALGGAMYGLRTPVIASFSIEGIDQGLNSSVLFGQVYARNNQINYSASQDTSGSDLGVSNEVKLGLYFASGGNSSIDNDFDGFAAVNITGSFKYIFDAADPADEQRITSGLLDVTSYSIASVTTAVPEPASWALMIGGFGIVGIAARRRRSAAAA